MTQKQLIDQFCEFRGKCTTDDVVALNFAYEMLAPHWISVEDDGNPIDIGWYIFTTGKIVDVGYYLGGNEWRDVHPTHWMPLPSIEHFRETTKMIEKGGEERVKLDRLFFVKIKTM